MKIKLKNHHGRLYHAAPLPSGSRMIGEVTRQRVGSGALVLLASGRFAQLNAGALTSLDQAEAARELLKAWAAENGLTQAAVADRFGVSANAVASWFSGRRSFGGAALKLLLMMNDFQLF
jgi:DNA-binding transcriptional regulator YiaG